ncbi:hypothetical protein CRYUN_Cryun32bG0036300 [Craigia yunnanensis]
MYWLENYASSILNVSSRNYPNDINEVVSTLIFAAARCGELPELQTIRKLFKERHESKFIKAIIELDL